NFPIFALAPLVARGRRTSSGQRGCGMSDVKETRFRVEGMDCASCAGKIDTAVRRMPGVSDVSVSVTAGTMRVRHDATSDLAAIRRKVSGLGYGVSPAEAAAEQPAEREHDPRCGHDHGHDHVAKAAA